MELTTHDDLKVTNLTVSSKSVILSVLLNLRASSAQLSNLNVLNNSGNSIVSIDQSSVQFRDVIFQNSAAVANSSLMLTSTINCDQSSVQFRDVIFKNNTAVAKSSYIAWYTSDPLPHLKEVTSFI